MQYGARIERGGIGVSVEVVVAERLTHSDIDELQEVVAHAATAVSTRVHESVERGELGR